MALSCSIVANGFCCPVQAQGDRPAANPLGQLFRNLDRGIREGGEQLEREKFGRDQLDIRPIQRPEDHRRLSQAQELLQAGRWHDGVEVLQFLLDQRTDAFKIEEPREFRSVQSEVDRIVDSLPAEGRRNYISRFGIQAEKLLQQGIAEQDQALLQRVARQYLHTPAGGKALRILAQSWDDEGEPGLAAEAWLRLIPDAGESEQLSLKRSASRALGAAGRTSEALEILKSVPDSEQLQREIESMRLPTIFVDDRAGPYIPFTDAVQMQGEPDVVPLTRWSASLIERYAVEQQVETLAGELHEQDRALLPTIQPLTVNGKLAFRTLRSLQVRDVVTGRLLWERRMRYSPEELLSGSLSADKEFLIQTLMLEEAPPEQSHLASLLFRDQVYGSITSDGSCLFSVDSTGEALLAAPIQVWRHRDDKAESAVPWETNELTAYDLETGQIRWRIGGAEIEPQFSRPLAGTYFFGAPLPRGEELYVIGEQAGEISLFCLSAQTGELWWSQPLVEPGRPLSEDIVRRHWPCQPVLTDSCILCPTSSGWLIAVDRISHRLQWGCRYAPRLEQHQQFRGAYSMQLLQELNRRWQDVITLVGDGRAVITPPEMPDEFAVTQPLMFCIDVQTGKILWEQQKMERSGGKALYVAGLWNGQAILVGTKAVVARSLEKQGAVSWSVALAQQPSGRGLIVNNRLLLPVTEAKLLTIDLKSALIEKAMMPDLPEDLGNLKLHRGQLVSVSYQRAVVFPAGGMPPDADRNPEMMARSQLREAKLLLANGQYEQLRKFLNSTFTMDALPAELRQAVSALQRTAILHLLESRPGNAELLLDELHALATTPQQQRDEQCLRVDHLLRTGSHQAAVDGLLQILEEFPVTEKIPDGTRELRVDSWVGGKLSRLYQSLPVEDKQASLDQSRFIAQTRERLKSLDTNPVVRDRWARAFGFHELGLKLEHELAMSAFAHGQTAAGLLRLQRIVMSSDAEQRIAATADIAGQLAQIGWHRDALYYWQQLQREPESTRVDDRPAHAVAAEGIAAAQAALDQQNQQPSIWTGPWRLERVGVAGNERSSSAVPVVGTGLHGLRELQIVQESEIARLRVTGRSNGRFLASFPLRGLAALEHNTNVGIRQLGPISFVMNQGVLHALAWPDQQMVWTWTPELRGQALSRVAMVQSNLRHGQQLLPQFTAIRNLNRSRGQTGYLVGANARTVLLLCKDWIALDPLTGEELWRDHDAPDRGTAYELGDDAFVTVKRSERRIRSAVDGHVFRDDQREDLVERMLVVDHFDLISFERKPAPAEGRSGFEVKRANARGDVLWTSTIPDDALLGVPDHRSLLWLTPERKLSLLNLQTGRTHPLGELSLPEASQQAVVSAMCDDDRIFVFVDSGDTQPTYVNMPALRFAGQILAFDRQGRTLWNYQTPLQTRDEPAEKTPKANEPVKAKTPPRHWPLNVLVQEFTENPLIILVGEHPDGEGDLFFRQLCVLGIDKATGKPAINWQRPSESGGFSFLQLDPERRLIELRTYNERLQLKPGSPTSAESAQ